MDTMQPERESDSERPPERHGCVTAWLVFMIVSNVLISIAYILAKEFFLETLPGIDPWMLYALAVIGLVNVACAGALLHWKKWGFYGFVVTTVVVFGINLAGGLAQQAIGGPIGVLVLWVVLQIKAGDVKAWDHLR
ncbi:MAG: hypothetical protein AAGF12_37400 [Myxococcota bacterium]